MERSKYDVNCSGNNCADAPKDLEGHIPRGKKKNQAKITAKMLVTDNSHKE